MGYRDMKFGDDLPEWNDWDKPSSNGHGDVEWRDYDTDGSRAEAVELASSMRGQWLIGMALYLTIDILKQQAEEFGELDEQDSKDLRDVGILMDKLFPLYRNVVDHGEENDDEELQ
tara:strand:- start:209 stop:556 length:348 start_codon:yes stop_codon:yes gene_type:complete